MLDELLDEAPVTWARSYGGPLLPPMILREPIPDFPRDIPANGTEEEGMENGDLSLIFENHHLIVALVSHSTNNVTQHIGQHNQSNKNK